MAKSPESDVTTNSDAAIVANKKKGKGRKKVEIRKIENPAQRHVTFSKRKDGLLKKSADLSKLTGVEVATIVVSSIGKVFCLGSPTLDTVLNRYLGVRDDSAAAEDRRVQELMEAKRLLEVEKNNNNNKNVIISDNCCGGGWWWEKPVAAVPVEEIEAYEAALLRLQYNVEEVRRNQMNYIWEDNYNNYSMGMGMEDGVLEC